MGKSRKRFITQDKPKSSWKYNHDSRVRNTSNQILKNIVNGKLDIDDVSCIDGDTVVDTVYDYVDEYETEEE